MPVGTQTYGGAMHPPTTARRLLVALAIGLPVATAACSGTTSAPATTSAGGTTASSTAATPASFRCADAPAAAVNAALGTSVGAPSTQTNGSVTVCTYSSTSPIQTVIIRVDTASSAGTFAAEKSQASTGGQTVTAVTGVGDDAYATTLSGGGFTTNTFAVRIGTVEVQVSGPGTPAQTQAYAVALAHTA